MFLVLPFGFYSVVLARSSDAQGAPPDPNFVQVRARLRDHLVELQRRFPDLLGRFEILHTPRGDYKYRIGSVRKQTWATVLAEIAMDHDVTNVKAAVSAYQTDKGPAGRAFTAAVGEAWHAFLKLEQFEHGLGQKEPKQ